jgi:hypothetical protein
VLHNKKQQQGQQQQFNNIESNKNCEDFGKISANVKATGQQKWKNSTQQTKTNGPKHIIFKNSDSSESSDESDKEEIRPIAPKAKVNNQKSASPAAKKAASEASSKYYEPSKEDQLDAVSYNRSYFIKNTNNLIEFKKAFNAETLNAPQSEEFAYRPAQTNSKSEFNLNTSSSSTSSTCSTASTASTASSSSSSSNSTISGDKSKEVINKRSSPRTVTVPKICYDEYPSVVGAPRVHDIVAFQMVEISANFTPEVSGYKTGKVVEFDNLSQEITLEMENNNKYNQVLKRASKFSVLFDETDEEKSAEDQEDQDYDIIDKKRRDSQTAENIIKIDWRNLMNLKMCPAELKQKLVSEVVQEQPLNLHV